MRAFFSSLKISLVTLILLTVLLGVIYPCFIWGVGQIFFHKKANGTLFYYRDGTVIGSEWIGQNFSSVRYFHPRPSSAGNAGYDAANSSGSNLGPISWKLIDSVRARVSAYRSENSLSDDVKIPADAVTASGSGLDPHISVENALIQCRRVAAARSISIDQMKQLVENYIEGRSLGLFGEKRVNVLRLNLALDKITSTEGS